MKKGIWPLVIEYFLAMPILGFPFYAFISVWAVKNSMSIIGIILIAVFYGSLAFYQLKRVSIVGSRNGVKLCAFIGVVCVITSLFFLLDLLQINPSRVITSEPIGTGDPATINGIAIVMSSLGFGFLLGFSILFLGYSRLEYMANQINIC